MKNIYVDTNVLLAAHMPEDPFHGSSHKLYTRFGVEYVGYTSPLSLIEVAGVVSRRMLSFRFDSADSSPQGKLGGLSTSEKVRLVAYRIFSKAGLNVFHVPGDVTLDVSGGRVSMPTVLSHALVHSIRFGLRALDAYHFATAYDIVHVYRTPLTFLVSNDRHFLDSRRDVGKALNLVVTSSTELEALEGF